MVKNPDGSPEEGTPEADDPPQGQESAIPPASVAYVQWCERHMVKDVYTMLQLQMEAGSGGVSYTGFIPEPVIRDLREQGYWVGMKCINAEDQADPYPNVEYAILWAR